MGITDFLRENASRFDNIKDLINATEKELGRPRKNIMSAYYDIQVSRRPLSFGIKTMPEPVRRVTNGISESELRQKHDTKFIIEQAAKKLERGVFVMDADFVKQCNLRTQAGYRQFIEGSEFSKFKGRAGGITYWSHPESIARMKNEGILN